MTDWKVEVTKRAQAELEGLAADLQARFLRVSELLEKEGPQKVSSTSHVKYLGGELWEMRLRGPRGIARVVYFNASGKRLIVVRCFVKKTQKTPRSEIELALKRMKEWKDG